jgi:predicted PurR-regulated permease PerM
MTINGRNIAIALSGVIVIAILYSLRSIVSYVLIAWVISMLGQPLMQFFKRFRYKRAHIPPSVAAMFTLLIFILIITSFFLIFVPMIVEQANNLAQIDYNKAAQTLEKPLADLTVRLQKFGIISKKETAITAIEHYVTEHVKPESFGSLFGSVVSTAGGIFVGVFAVIFIAFFFLKEQKMFSEFLVSVFPSRHEENIKEAVKDTATLLSRYFSGILLQMLFVALFLSATMWLLGVQNAFIVAVFAAIINIVPYLGPWLGCLFAVAVTITSNLNLDFYSQTVPLLFKVVLLFGSMQFLNDWIVQPLIFSNRVLAHPLEIFLVTLIGAKLGGITGMVLAIPAYTVLRVIARAFFNQFRFVQKMTDSLEEVVDGNSQNNDLVH